ncbi:hypothetical protein GCM10010129_82280 [Streptomyces fumigatiscleroticus]|nr:hypothetical protein GCM10010129_82280 [Streptomyces fumigatiscleroticus]
MKVSHEFCEKMWHVLAQVSASCPLDLSNWLRISMGGRCASKYRTSHGMAAEYDAFVKRLVHLDPSTHTQNTKWTVLDKDGEDNFGYEYLDDVVASLMKQI